jgi:hypothetical protein
MIREVAETSPLEAAGSEDFSQEHSDAVARWLDAIDRTDQVRMLHAMYDRISVSKFNHRFEDENSNNFYEVVKELQEQALAVKISNSELQPETSDEYLKDARDGDDNWYHLTPLGLEFLRAIFNHDGPPLLAPIVIADDLKAFIKGLPDEARRIDEHLVRADQADPETEFAGFRESVFEGEYAGSLAPPIVPEDPYLLAREMDITVWEGANTLEGQRTVEAKVADAIQGRTQVRLFGPWAPTTSAQVFDETTERPNVFHQFIAGQKFIERLGSDERTESAKMFLRDARDHPDVRVESTSRYLPYVLGIVEDTEQTDSELFIWGRGNPEEESYMMFARTDNPSPALYEWATDLFEYVAERAEEYSN